MFALIFIGLIALLVIGIMFDPSRRLAVATHAARANKNASLWRRHQYVSLPDTIEDIYGHDVTTGEKFVGSVFGKSCIRFGLHDGDVFLADILDGEARTKLTTGDIIVVDAPAEHSNLNRRIRKIQSISEKGVIAFVKDAANKTHTVRNLDQAFARVSHVLT